MVKLVAKKLSGILVPGCMYSEALQGWFLKFRGDSKKLFISVEILIEWLANKNPPCAAYFSFISGFMIAFDKQLVVCPVSVIKTWRRLFARFLLKVTRPEATNACQDDHLCDWLKAITDGAVHGVQVIWDEKFSTENWCFLLVDAKNVFNKINCIGILWMVCPFWPSVAHLLLFLLSLVTAHIAELEWDGQFPEQ